jgi:hypothetical protein
MREKQGTGKVNKLQNRLCNRLRKVVNHLFYTRHNALLKKTLRSLHLRYVILSKTVEHVMEQTLYGKHHSFNVNSLKMKYLLRTVQVLICMLCLNLFAPANVVAQASDLNRDERTITDTDDDDTGNWGLLGLIGLAGLIGLKGKEPDRIRTTTSGTTNPNR